MGTTEDKMIGWHHRLDEHESEQAPGVGDGQGSLVCYSPWGRKDSATELTESCDKVAERYTHKNECIYNQYNLNKPCELYQC